VLNELRRVLKDDIRDLELSPFAHLTNVAFTNKVGCEELLGLLVYIGV